MVGAQSNLGIGLIAFFRFQTEAVSLIKQKESAPIKFIR